MGLGKTIQAIALCCYYHEEWPVLVITPSSLRLVWAEQFERWVPNLASSDINLVMNGKCGLDGKINIISYDLVRQLEKPLLEKRFRIVVADESHFLKSYGTKRTTTALPLLHQASRRILLTGTPALSRPVELHPQLCALDPTIFPKNKLYDFAARYCNATQGKFGWDYTGSSNLRELHVLLERLFMIRRLKEEVGSVVFCTNRITSCQVLTELPPKRREKIHVEIKREHTHIIKKIYAEIKKNKQLSESGIQKEAREAHNAKQGLFMELFSDSGTHTPYVPL